MGEQHIAKIREVLERMKNHSLCCSAFGVLVDMDALERDVDLQVRRAAWAEGAAWWLLQWNPDGCDAVLAAYPQAEKREEGE